MDLLRTFVPFSTEILNHSSSLLFLHILIILAHLSPTLPKPWTYQNSISASTIPSKESINFELWPSNAKRRAKSAPSNSFPQTLGKVKEEKSIIKTYHSTSPIVFSELETDNSHHRKRNSEVSMPTPTKTKMNSNSTAIVGNVKSSKYFQASPLLYVSGTDHGTVADRRTRGGESENTWGFHNNAQIQYNAATVVKGYGNGKMNNDNVLVVTPKKDHVGVIVPSAAGDSVKNNNFNTNPEFQIQTSPSPQIPSSFFYTHPKILSPSPPSRNQVQEVKGSHYYKPQKHFITEIEEIKENSFPHAQFTRNNNNNAPTATAVDPDKESIGVIGFDSFSGSNHHGYNPHGHHNHNSQVKVSEMSSHTVQNTHQLKSELSPPSEDERFHGFYGLPPLMHLPKEMQPSHPVQLEMGHQTIHPEGYGHQNDEHHPHHHHHHEDEEEEEEEEKEERVKFNEKVFTKTVVGTKAIKKGSVIFVGFLALVVLILAALAKSGVFLSPIIFPLAFIPIGIIALALFIPLFILFVPIVALGLGGRKKRKKRSISYDNNATATGHFDLHENLNSTFVTPGDHILNYHHSSSKDDDYGLIRNHFLNTLLEDNFDTFLSMKLSHL